MMRKESSSCSHETCKGEYKPPRRKGEPVRMGPQAWWCDCPCHKLTGADRADYVATHPGPMERLSKEIEKMGLPPVKTFPPMPPVTIPEPFSDIEEDLFDLEMAMSLLPEGYHFIAPNGKVAPQGLLQYLEDAVLDAQLPEGYQWGEDAMDCFKVGTGQACLALREAFKKFYLKKD